MTYKISPDLGTLVHSLSTTSDLLSADRRQLLEQVGQHLAQRIAAEQVARLHFICTHNSRRSQLSQVWAATAAAYYGWDNVRTFSGGTEVTACNPRTISALERAGFRVIDPGGENPHYRVYFAPDRPPLMLYSKRIDDFVNPRADFVALMTCDHADQNCPFLPGASLRIPLTYSDPKEADDTPEEAARYDERTHQIGSEILYAFRHASTLLHR